MSRAKFEEWFVNSPPVFPTYKHWSQTTIVAYEAWLAGRESMRNEAADVCESAAEDGSDMDGYDTAYSCAHQIKQIEP